MYQLFFVVITLDKRYATGGGFLFAISMVGQNVFERNARQVYPAGIGRKMETQNIFCSVSRFHSCANLHAFYPNCKNLYVICTMRKEDFLLKKIDERKEQNAFRQLRLSESKIDFCSNDYLGLACHSQLTTPPLEGQAHNLPAGQAGSQFKHGSGGSRLLAGNYPLIEETEQF